MKKPSKAELYERCDELEKYYEKECIFSDQMARSNDEHVNELRKQTKLLAASILMNYILALILIIGLIWMI